MSTDLCPKHKLAIAPDRKCVLCRRQATPTSALQRQDEGLVGQLVTWVLLGCLLATFGGLVYIARTPGGHQGGRYVSNPDAQGLPHAQARELEAQSGATALDAQPPTDDLAITAAPAPSVERGEGSPAPSAAGDAGDVAPDTLRRPPVPPAIPAEALVQARKKVEIIMFVAPWCYICDRSRDFLNARDVVLTEYDIELDPEALDALSDINPATTIPTFHFEEKNEVIVGFHPWVLEDAINVAALEHYASR